MRRIQLVLVISMAAFMGLLPILWATGAGSDMMERIAAPMMGGLFTSFILELLVYLPIALILGRQTLHRISLKKVTGNP